MFFKKLTKKRIYLDYAAATPLHPEVKKVMLPFLDNFYGNPSAIHQEGVEASLVVESARQKVATILGVRPNGVIFTASGTESNNLAILGLVRKLHEVDGLPYNEMEIITTRIEHPSISELLPILTKQGVTIRFVEVDSEGKITTKALETVLSPRTVLVTFAYANSEVGVIQSVSRLSRLIRQHEKENKTKVLLHLDAAQAPLWLPCGLERLGVDLLSLDTGKCNGPKGVGLLIAQGTFSLLPIMHGGGQEQGLRPATENVMGIVGAAKALEIAQADYEKRAVKVSKVRDEFILKLKAAISGVCINGPEGESRLANNINFSLPKFDTEYAVVYLDHHGFSASTKSACAGAGGGESKVVLAMTGDSERAKSTIRFSIGENTTSSDMEAALDILIKFQQKMQELTK